MLGVAILGVGGGCPPCWGCRGGGFAFFFGGPLPPKKKKSKAPSPSAPWLVLGVAILGVGGVVIHIYIYIGKSLVT